MELHLSCIHKFCISNYAIAKQDYNWLIGGKVWDEMNYPFPNFHGEVGEWRSNFNQHLTDTSGFYTKGRPLVKSNLICPLDKLSWQPGCPVLNINIQGNFCISQGNGSSDNLPENLV